MKDYNHVILVPEWKITIKQEKLLSVVVISMFSFILAYATVHMI